MAKRISLLRMTAAGLALLSLGACAATYENHGFVPPASELAKVKVGEAKAQVAQDIGSPSLTGLQSTDAWYYVQSRWRHYGPFAPKEVKRQVVAISFDKAGKVANIEHFGLKDGAVVTISQRVTKSTVKGETLLQQLLRDVGQINPGDFLSKSGP